MNKTVIIAGVIVILAGIFWKYLIKIPLFRLPGDIIIDKPGFKMFIPVTSMIIISLVISFLFWLFRK